MEKSIQPASSYERYHIETLSAPDIVPWPNRFLVQVNRFQLAKLLIQEVFHQRGDIKAITSRPCMYGTFSGPIGGFAPRPQHCVGCLRCTTQHPDAVTIKPNPARERLGDSYFHFQHINAVTYEAKTGSIPVKGAGYRGKFGGEGWDGMWTDMSEIVRPTRDGIHGREFISTVVDIGEVPAYLVFDADGYPTGIIPSSISIPVPYIFDRMPPTVASSHLSEILTNAARQVQTLTILPVDDIPLLKSSGAHIIPLVNPGEKAKMDNLGFAPTMIEIDSTDQALPAVQSTFEKLQSSYPEAVISLRLTYKDPDTLMAYTDIGIRTFHLVADFHGRGTDGQFALELIRTAHQAFVDARIRGQVTLIGSGGIVAAEHVPKAIIAGLDLVALDTPLLVAMQAEFDGECADRQTSKFDLPENLPHDWAVQRIKNMSAAWRDQLLEILGAMGLREVRRLRGEMGRAMFQVDLEREAFAEIDGYDN